MNTQTIEELREFFKTRSFPSLTDTRTFRNYFSRNTQHLASLMTHFLPLSTLGEMSEGSVIDEVEILKSTLMPTDTIRPPLKIALKSITDQGLKLVGYASVEAQPEPFYNFAERIAFYGDILLEDQYHIHKHSLEFDRYVPGYSIVFLKQDCGLLEAVSPGYIHDGSTNFVKRAPTPPRLGPHHTIVELSKFHSMIHELEDIQDHWSFLIKNSQDMKGDECENFLAKKEEAASVESLWLTLIQNKYSQDLHHKRKLTL